MASKFRIPEFLTYLRIIRKLAKEKTINPSEVYHALYALDKAETDRKWKQQIGKMQLEAVDLSLYPPR